MSEGIQAAILFLIIFAGCYASFRVGVAEGKEEERRKQQRIRATQYSIREQHFTRR